MFIHSFNSYSVVDILNDHNYVYMLTWSCVVLSIMLSSFVCS